MNTWESTPSGVFRNHFLSEKLRTAAIEETIFLRFVEPEAGYGKGMGESLNITRVGALDIPSDAEIDEVTDVPLDTVDIAVTTISPKLIARGVSWTAVNEAFNKFDMPAQYEQALKDQLKLYLDKMAATAFKQTLVKYTPTSASGGSFSTNGTAAATAASNWNVAHIAAVRDYLNETLKCPPRTNGMYVGIFTTSGARGIKDDADFKDWMVRNREEYFRKSMIGDIEGVECHEINNTTSLSNSLGSGGVFNEGLIFGADAVAMASVVDPHLVGTVSDNFGLQKAVAWWGLIEFGIVWPTANAGECRIVHGTSL